MAPLHVASEYGHSKVVDVLLRNEAGVNVKDKNDPPKFTKIFKILNS